MYSFDGIGSRYLKSYVICAKDYRWMRTLKQRKYKVSNHRYLCRCRIAMLCYAMAGHFSDNFSQTALHPSFSRHILVLVSATSRH